MVQLQTNTGKMNLIQIDFPTTNNDDNEIEAFNERLKDILKLGRNRDFIIVMGDFNGKIGMGSFEGYVDKF